MIRIRRYIVPLIVLLLVAGPWLHASGVEATPEEAYCGCCQGPCEGCCCSTPSSSTGHGSPDDGSGCTCELAEVPKIPDLPMEFQEHRLVNKLVDNDVESRLEARSDYGQDKQRVLSDKSPPRTAFQPAYILFSTLLI